MSPAQTLIDDASLLENPALADVPTRWRSATVRPDSVVAPDQQLAALDRLAAHGDPVPNDSLPVTVINTTGAGGLVSLAGRATPHLEIHAVRSALRDLDDLTGNAARVVSAAAELNEEIEVYVELPDAWGWERAAEVVEAAGLFAGLTATASSTRVTTGGPTTAGPENALIFRMSALVELDLGFALDARSLVPTSIPALLAAVDALIDDASPEQAAALLSGETPVDLTSWDAQRQSRAARRLRRVLTTDAAAALAALAAAGLQRT